MRDDLLHMPSRPVLNAHPDAEAPDRERASFRASRRIPGLEMLKARYLSHSFSRHAHDGYALGVITHGALAFRFLGRNHVAPAGTVNLVVPGEIHDGHGADAQGWAYRMFYLAPDMVRQVAVEAGVLSGGSPHLPDFSSGVLDDPVLAVAVGRLHADMEAQGRAMPSLEQESRLLALLTRWVSLHGDQGRGRLPGAGQEPGAVRLVREYIEAHVHEDVRLETLASLAQLSPFYLVRVFTRVTGLPPHAYHMQRRVACARNLLETSLPLVDVALACGFSDQSHLTRQFKKVLGIPPGTYRKIMQER